MKINTIYWNWEYYFTTKLNRLKEANLSKADDTKVGGIF